MTTRNKPKKIDEDIGTEDRSKDAEKLLEALEENGPCVIHDFELLKSYFPYFKSDDQLRKLIDSYERRGKELSLKQNYLDDLIEMKNINQWLSVISKCVPFPAKKDDYSHVLENICTKFLEDAKNKYYNKENGEDEDDYEVDEDSEDGDDDESDDTSGDDEIDESNEDDEDMLPIAKREGNGEENPKGNDTLKKSNAEKINYEAIYSYFIKILESRFPRRLQDKEAAIAHSLMTKVFEITESLRNEDEKAFLLSESWWKPTAVTNSDTINGQDDNSDANETANSANGVNRDQPEYYEDLPRFRKIRDCLNPLKIPNQILNKNHDLLSSRLHGPAESSFPPNSE